MNIAELMNGVDLRTAIPDEVARVEVDGLEYDSRRAAAGYVFFAFPGAKVDGRVFAQQAVERGAVAVVSELEAPAGFAAAPWIQVAHGRKALSTAARNFYKAPDDAVGVTGITGTNGKTTTCFLTDAILRASGRTTAALGTIEYHVAGRKLAAANTTPESLDIFRILDEVRSLGGLNATMEISSHALALGRVHGLKVHTAVFTNLTRDHLDFHGTMEAYFAAKQMLFESAPVPEFAVINLDDSYGPQIRLRPETKACYYTLSETATAGEYCFRASRIENTFEGLRFELRLGDQRARVESALVGKINVYNILAASAAAWTYGLSLDAIVRGIATCRGVPGRFERVDAGQPFLVVVDYAHTDDALRNVISVARGLKPKRVITLFGCGGDRDRAKRPLMGMAAAEASDYVVLTSDNPRSEDPLDIINDAMVGIRRFDTPHVAEPDREKGIRKALEQARAGDIVILAGKGHEPYQILKDRTIQFDDRETAHRLLREMGYGA